MSVFFPPPQCLARISELQAAIAATDFNLSSFMQDMVEVVQELTNADGAVIEISREEEMVYLCASGMAENSVGQRLPRKGSLAGLCADRNEAMHCEDAMIDIRVNAEARGRAGMRSMICAPLAHHAAPVGVLAALSAKPHHFTPVHVDILNVLAGLLSSTLSNQLAVDRLHQTEFELRASESRTRLILELANDAVIATDESTIVIGWNRAAERLFGWTADEAEGQAIASLIVPKEKRPLFIEQLAEMLQDTHHAALSLRQEFEAVNRAGERMHVEASLKQYWFGKRKEWIAFIHDITERKRASEAIHEMALTDSLTGLANRRQFMDLLKQAIARTQRKGGKLASMFMDLNGFKKINDELGHDVGDHALREYARRVTSSLRASDVFARLGGDEFAIFAEDLENDEQVHSLINKILASLDAPIEPYNLLLGTSIGTCFYQSPDDADAFMQKADSAMYRAKRQSTQRYRVSVSPVLPG